MNVTKTSTSSPKSKLEIIRERARKSYYFFAKHVLDYSKMRKNPHQELCNLVESKKKRKKLVLMPRNSFKSSVVTVGYSLYSMVKNPSIRILIASETQKNARKYVRECREHIESNPKFRAVFGDWTSKRLTWRDDEFVISTRTQIKREATLQSGSLEKGTQTGMHYDLIILDDPVSLNNINTSDQFEKTINFYRMLLSVLDPEGVVVIIGTRYHVRDLYAHICDPDNSDREQFEVMIKKAIDDFGKPLMPDVLTEQFLKEQRAIQGEYLFSGQYLNDPTSSDNAVFHSTQIQYYDKPPSNLVYYMSIDPAVSTRKTSDFTALIVLGVDSKHHWYVLEAIEVKAKPSDIIDLTFENVLKYHPMDKLILERFMAEKFLKDALYREMEVKQMFFPIEEITTDTRHAKETRIRGLQPKFERREVFIHKRFSRLINQLLMYPQVKNDDLVDALKNFKGKTLPADEKWDDKPELKSNLSPQEKKIWEEVRAMGKIRKIRRVKRRLWRA